MMSYTSSREGLEPALDALAAVKGSLNAGGEEDHTSCVIHCSKRNEGFKTSSKDQYVARCGNFIDGGQEYNGELQILKVILGYD